MKAPIPRYTGRTTIIKGLADIPAIEETITTYDLWMWPVSEVR